ncbi:IQ motif, EF-hand binding site [Dillenia turbinata]|uniref:IQ motif, EF-hand binding site n=1 Tax=Dillenia turbinata TaxID=194707 RepID=A0AAN8ZC58_9MAGN
MGKSPGKWIKTLLFGKKSSKSNISKKARGQKETFIAAKSHSGGLHEDPPADLNLEIHSTNGNGENALLERGTSANLPPDVIVSLPEDWDTGFSELSNAEITRQEQAAVKLQAAFRGYLARRASKALKGIIRLQALVRGHLVRRQAVATLISVTGIVKLQAVIRGQRVRLSDPGLKVQKILLLASQKSAMLLRLQYDSAHPNSSWNWVERWSVSNSWEVPEQSKKSDDSRSQKKHGNGPAPEAESGKSKRGSRKGLTTNSDSFSLPSATENEKPKRSIRKVLSHQAESVPESPQTELERVKRNLRKVSAATAEATDKSETASEKPKPCLKKLHAPVLGVSEGIDDSCEKTKQSLQKLSSYPSELGIDVSSEQKNDPIVKDFKQLEIETSPKSLPVTGYVDMLKDHPYVEETPLLENGEKIEGILAANAELSSKDDHTNKENQRTRRRKSFPAKQELSENGAENTPTLPSYMAATESAKAKLRGQASPRFGQDGPENGFTRRHSLPSSTNGKASSPSPRMQKLVQANGRTRSDRSLLSSRDGHEKVTQVGWRR